MRKAIADFTLDIHLPVTAIPIVALEGLEGLISAAEHKALLLRAKVLAWQMFDVTVHVTEPFFLGSETASDLREHILGIVQEHMQDERFRQHWLAALTEDLAAECRALLSRNASNDSDGAILKAGRAAIADMIAKTPRAGSTWQSDSSVLLFSIGMFLCIGNLVLVAALTSPFALL